MKTEYAVQQRYSGAAKAPEAALCCPIQYDAQYLESIPQEVIEKDYGCGDPSRYVRPGETVLDLGSGTGKICFIASQVVGPTGKVIGVDMTDDMLEVARRNAPIVAERIGHANVEFRKGRIQDLALDLEKLDAELAKRPISNAASFFAAEGLADELREQSPLVASDSIDVVVSNCVLNLVNTDARWEMFTEIFRVLKVGGRAVISDIVADEEVPDEMREDHELWSGCISGAMTEEEFLQAFAEAGFYGVELVNYDAQPWRTVNGIEFRSVTVQAFKGEKKAGLDRNQAVIYKGPFLEIVDDDGHLMERGRRYAVSDRTFDVLQKAPYREFFEFIEPHADVAIDDAPVFDRELGAIRHPGETKGTDYDATTPGASQCCGGDNGGCC